MHIVNQRFEITHHTSEEQEVLLLYVEISFSGKDFTGFYIIAVAELASTFRS